jgi:hypothetical protein
MTTVGERQYMNNAKKRLEKLEQHNAVQEKPGPRTIIYLSYSETDFLPDVFDRPIKDWESYKNADNPDLVLFLLVVDPYSEAVLRGGGLPLCPGSRYTEWQIQQNEQLKPQSTPEVVRYAPYPANDEIGQNCTKPDVLR